MKFLLFLITLTCALASSAAETFICSRFNQAGALTTEFRITVFPSSLKAVSSLSIMKNSYYESELIYSKEDNQLIGDRIRLPIPPFMSFGKWKEECHLYLSKNCAQEDYVLAEKKYKQLAKWMIFPYQISDDDEKYGVLKTSLKETQTISTKVRFSGQSGTYNVYESDIAELDSSLFVTNELHTNFLLSKDSLKAKVTFMDNFGSYALRIDVGEQSEAQRKIVSPVSAVITCNK